jgi:type II secretory pathway pseudopilin PulG
MKKLSKGFTLIEVLIFLIMLTGFIFIFLQIDISVEDKQNKRKVGNQLNQIVTAIDKRVSIEGKKLSNWNSTEWDGADVKKFFREELVGADNQTCGQPNGWKPNLDLKGIDVNSEEGKELNYLLDQAKITKLLPCSFWAIYPNKIVPNIKISNDGNGNVSDFMLSFKFADNADWKLNFKNFNQSFVFGKDKKSTTLLTSKEYYYANNAKNKISLKQCVDLKEECNFIIAIKIGSDSKDDKKFKIDSSNNFETNLGFAKSIKENDQIDCNIWTLNKAVVPAVWESKLTACGVTGGSSGFKEIALLGNDIDAESIIVKGKCKDYSQDLSSIDAECGMYNDSIVQLSVINGQATRIIAQSLYSESVYTSNLAVKNDSKVTALTRSYGKNKKDEIAATNTYTPVDPFDMNRLDSDYRDTMAESSYKTKNLVSKNLTVSNEIKLNDSIKTDDLTLTDRAHIKKTTNANSVIGQYESASKFLDNGSSINPATINNQLKINNYAEIDSIDSLRRSVIAGDVKATNIIASNILQTEQLNFRNSFDSKSNIVNFSKSASFDGLGNKYIYPSGFIEGWGQKGYLSNSGIAAKKIKVNGNLILNTNTDVLPFGVYTSANYISNHLGLRKGLSVTHLFPDPRSFFTMNEYGRVLVSAYYTLGNNTTGLKVGTGFFFGRNIANLIDVGDKPIITNLASAIYGYKPGDNITALTYGYKFIARNLHVKTKHGANFYDGAIFHKSMPKDFGGNPVNILYMTSPLGFYWETADNVKLRHQDSNVLYYLNQISYIYGLYVKLNEKGIISGEKGERGEQGETGAQGIRGVNGSEGIPGIVGLRGGV